MVIIQNDVGNRHSPTTIVAAISTQIRTKANLPTHYHLKPGSGLVQPSMVMLEQIRTVDKTRLVQYIGKLSDGELKGLNHALAISIGLIPTTPEKLILCLCSTCAENFYGSGAYYLRRVILSRLKRSCVPTVTRGLDLIMKSPLGIKAGKQVRTFVKSFSFL